MLMEFTLILSFKFLIVEFFCSEKQTEVTHAQNFTTFFLTG